jgi:hypothetical protein
MDLVKNQKLLKRKPENPKANYSCSSNPSDAIIQSCIIEETQIMRLNVWREWPMQTQAIPKS